MTPAKLGDYNAVVGVLLVGEKKWKANADEIMMMGLQLLLSYSRSSNLTRIMTSIATKFIV